MNEAVCVIRLTEDDDVRGRLGDAREIADRLRWPVVAVDCRLPVRPPGGEAEAREPAETWIHQGADEVHVVSLGARGQEALLAAFDSLWQEGAPRLILSSAEGVGRAWSARMAARKRWALCSPSLQVRVKDQRLFATRLDSSGRRARLEELPVDRPAIVAFRPGVAQPVPRDITRQGTIREHSVPMSAAAGTMNVERLPADPATADVRHLPKLVAGGRGVGSRAGFDILRRVAARLGAGVAASRVAVDLGWIEPERQVGQTGKTVQPELYLACGISGASHHWEGMSQARHIVAINTDAEAPLLKKSHLALQGDLHAILRELDTLLEAST